MKRILTLALLLSVCMGASAGKDPRILSREKGSITFAVDDVTPRNLEYGSPASEGSAIAERLIGESYIHGGEMPELISCSFRQDSFFNYGKAPLFSMLVYAYSNHRPIVLTPDVVWLVICQGFSNYVNENADKLRDLFVDHSGKMTLAVRSRADLTSREADWETLLDSFGKQIEKNTKGKLAKTVKADFTTSGKAEKLASQITLMDIVSPYFEYISFYVMCGIPSVTLEGTPRDWSRLLKKVNMLDKYGMGWWADDLRPILKQFVCASKGKPDYQFWKNIVKVQPVDEVEEPGCGDVEGATLLDGWFLKLFPFSASGRTPEAVYSDHEMISEMVSVPFRYQVLGGGGEVVSDTPLELYAGLVGVEEDPVTYAMRAKVGWMVTTAPDLEEASANLHDNAENGWVQLRVNEVPEALRGIHKIERLCLEFTGKVVLPSWMDDIEISEFIIRGEVSAQEQQAILKRFPNCSFE